MGCKLVNAADAHDTDALDTFWIETAAPLTGPTDIRGIVLDGAYELRPEP